MVRGSGSVAGSSMATRTERQGVNYSRSRTMDFGQILTIPADFLLDARVAT